MSTAATTSAYEHAYASLLVFKALVSNSEKLRFAICASPWSVKYIAARVVTLCCSEFPKMLHGEGSLVDCAANVTETLIFRAISPFYCPVPVVSREAAIAGAAFLPDVPEELQQGQHGQQQMQEDSWGTWGTWVDNFAEYMENTKTVAPADMAISTKFATRAMTALHPSSCLGTAEEEDEEYDGEVEEGDDDADDERAFKCIWEMVANMKGIRSSSSSIFSMYRTADKALWLFFTDQSAREETRRKAFLAGVILCALCLGLAGSDMVGYMGEIDPILDSTEVVNTLSRCLYSGACMIHKLMRRKRNHHKEDSGHEDNEEEEDASLAVAFRFWVSTCHYEVYREASLSIGKGMKFETSIRALNEYYAGPMPRYPGSGKPIRMFVDCKCSPERESKAYSALSIMAHSACHQAGEFHPGVILEWFLEHDAFGTKLPWVFVGKDKGAAILVDKSLFRNRQWGHMQPGTEFHRLIVHTARIYRGAEDRYRRRPRGSSPPTLPCSREDFIAQWAIAYVMCADGVISWYRAPSSVVLQQQQQAGHQVVQGQVQGQGGVHVSQVQGHQEHLQGQEGVHVPQVQGHQGHQQARQGGAHVSRGQGQYQQVKQQQQQMGAVRKAYAWIGGLF